jgi:hypothetical protein
MWMPEIVMKPEVVAMREALRLARGNASSEVYMTACLMEAARVLLSFEPGALPEQFREEAEASWNAETGARAP